MLANLFSNKKILTNDWKLISKLPYSYTSSGFYNFEKKTYTTENAPASMLSGTVLCADDIVYHASTLTPQLKFIGNDISTKEIMMEIAKDEEIKKYNYITITNGLFKHSKGKDIITLVNNSPDATKNTHIEYTIKY
jgi:hypothetical protein